MANSSSSAEFKEPVRLSCLQGGLMKRKPRRFPARKRPLFHSFLPTADGSALLRRPRSRKFQSQVDRLSSSMTYRRDGMSPEPAGLKTTQSSFHIPFS